VEQRVPSSYVLLLERLAELALQVRALTILDQLLARVDQHEQRQHVLDVLVPVERFSLDAILHLGRLVHDSRQHGRQLVIEAGKPIES
jgi:hypothetical protein